MSEQDVGPPGEWVPVDSVLKAASEEMQSGQLIHGDAFDLFQVFET